MKNLRKRSFRNHKLPIQSYSDTSGKPFSVYLKPKDISPGKAAEILSRLNSFDSAEQLKSAIQKHPEGMILSNGDAQRILRSKEALGKFQDLEQVATVLRIGAKKFDFIVRLLSNKE